MAYKKSARKQFLENKIAELNQQLIDQRKSTAEQIKEITKVHATEIAAINKSHKKELVVVRKEAVKVATSRHTLDKLAYKRKAREQLRKRRKKKALATVYNRELQYMPVALAYSSFVAFGRKQGITQQEFCFLIIVNALNKITAIGMGKFGYDSVSGSYQLLESLTNKGYLTRIKSRFVFYSVALKGRNLVNKYKEFHRKYRITLLEHEEFKGRDIPGWG